MRLKELKVKNDISRVDVSLYGEKNLNESAALLYHENSKLNRLTSRRFGQNIQRFNNPFYNERASQPYKPYPGSKVIRFDDYKIDLAEDIDIFKLTQSRRSLRNYKSDYRISYHEIFRILYYSYGLTGLGKIEGSEYGTWGFRCVPSGGGLYPLELYFVVFSGMPAAGVYHYRPDINGIELIKSGHFYEALKDIILAEPYVEFGNACGVLIITSVAERMMIKYGERGYRFILQETGAVSQQVSLICSAIGLGSCWVGGYLDDQLNRFLGVDGLFESVQNCIVIGRPNDETK